MAYDVIAPLVPNRAVVYPNVPPRDVKPVRIEGGYVDDIVIVLWGAYIPKI